MDSSSPNLVTLTSTIVGAFVGANTISRDDIPALIAAVHKALATADAPEAATPDTPAKPTAAQIRRSIRPDALISFEDCRAYKTLKRHLSTHGLTLDEYKAKWGLPKDYPTTAPSYSAARSALAKAAGLGQPARPSAPEIVAEPPAEAAAAEMPPPARRARSKKAAARAPTG